MGEYRISTEAIEQGLDRKHLFDLRARFQEVNRERLARTLSALSDRQQQFLTLLPLLFHTNHPMLPGYSSHQTPSGIVGYSPDKNALRLAQGVARSFKWQHDPHQVRDIEALFAMGSVGTVAHSDSSDLDFWVCYQPGLSPARLEQLAQKCQLLTRQAAQIGLEAHFFLMDCAAFRRGENSALDSESSGSAQHYLLLDEFYRTALHLAGREPLWWLVPAACEERYREYADTLVGRRFLNGDEVLDFGGTDGFPAGEYVGAGIWQLYKAIESPYKSVLKLMLLECYASDHPDERPLSLQFKQMIYDGKLDVDELDPYVMIYRVLEHYLRTRGELKRLELLRRCLYFKINKPLTRTHKGKQKSWQRRLLEKLVKEWGWRKEQLYLLDSRPQWKAAQVISERRQLVNELTNSYRFLVDFARQTRTEMVIDIAELNVLGRKLHAAFDRKAGKVDWINPGISPDLAERHLSLVANGTSARQPESWQVFTRPLREQPFAPDSAIKHCRHLGELLLWCHCNGLLTAQTQVDIQETLPSPLLEQLRPALKALRQWLPLPLPNPTHEAFSSRANTVQLLLLINLGCDPQERLQQQGIHRLSNQTDSLGYSALKENLVASIDWVSLNSWNEVTSTRFSDQALLDCLLHYLNELPPDVNDTQTGGPAPLIRKLPQLSVHCLNHNRGTIIAQRVKELFEDLVTCFYSGHYPLNSRYLFEMSGHFYVLQILDGQPQIQCLETETALFSHLAQAQSSYSPLVMDRYCLKGSPLSAIASAPRSAAINVYYRLAEQEAALYVVDELGSLFHWRQSYHNQQSLLRPLHRFLRAVTDRREWEMPDAGLLGNQSVAFHELLSPTPRDTRIEPRAVTTDLNRLHFFNVQAVAEPGSDDNLQFNFYCDQQEFCEWEWGEALYSAVSDHVLAQRESGEPYPCYITDLDLSPCKQLLARGGRLQTVHYLRIKAQLESRLNANLNRT